MILLGGAFSIQVQFHTYYASERIAYGGIYQIRVKWSVAINLLDALRLSNSSNMQKYGTFQVDCPSLKGMLYWMFWFLFLQIEKQRGTS